MKTLHENTQSSTRSADVTRRSFVAAGAAAAATVTAATTPAARAAMSLATPTVPGGTHEILVVVFLRGGMDGLTAVPPHAESELYTQRPGLAIPRPGQPNGAIDLDGFFGLAPAAGAFEPLYTAGDLSFVHAAGSTDPSRSHFNQQARMEAGRPNPIPGTLLTSGWLGRYLAGRPQQGTGPLRGMVLNNLLTLTMAGAPAVLPVSNPDRVVFPGSRSTAQLRRMLLEAVYDHAVAPLGTAGIRTLDSIDLLNSIDFSGYMPANGATYPTTSFGEKLKDAAALMKGYGDIEVIQVDAGGWDDHNNQGPINGQMAASLRDLSESLAAFWADLGALQQRVTVVAMSEFGRRVDQNGSAGTDHGRGGVISVLSGNTNGGQVHGQWPTLAPSALDNRALAVANDYRDILAEILVDRMGASNADIDRAFPGHTPSFLGLMR